MAKAFKFIQINIYKGKYLDSLVSFLKSEEPDFISMQEVTWGALNLCEDRKTNLFELLKEKLSMAGVCYFDWKVKENPGSLGNAVFSKYPITDHKVIVLNEPVEVDMDFVQGELGFENAPRHIIDALVDVNGGHLVHTISWHGAWTAPPVDTKETLRQSRMVRDYLQELNNKREPFLLGGDLNSIRDNETIKLLSRAANNLMLGSGFKQTTHPKIHKIAPRGFLVDYIMTSKDFKVKSLRVPDIIVSDHLPVVAEVEM